RGPRRAERRRAAAQRPPRPALARPRDAARPERIARFAVLDRTGVAADPVPREGAARARPGQDDDVRGARHALMPRKRRTPVNRRLRLLLLFLVAGFAVLLGRAAWLQAVQAGSLSRLATKQHRETVVLPASRGTIFDRTGVQLAIGEQATTVYADPRQIRDPRLVATDAARTLGVNG